MISSLFFKIKQNHGAFTESRMELIKLLFKKILKLKKEKGKNEQKQYRAK